jgi:hypothetical protein
MTDTVKAESRAKTETEVFDILSEHGIKRVMGQIGTDSRAYAGWLIYHDGVFLWAHTDKEEQLINEEVDERCGFENMDLPPFEDGSLDLDVYMQSRVDACLSSHYENKRKWEAQGLIIYDVPERTVTLDFLVRTGKLLREYIEVTWKVDEKEPIKKEIKKMPRCTKSELEWEKDHMLWDHWDEAA